MTRALELSWPTANRAVLDAELRRLRLLLQQRVLWLRRQWQHDPLQPYRGMVISDTQADWLLVGEDPAAAALFYREDAEAAALGSLASDARRDAEARGRALMEAGSPAAVDLLTHVLGLTPFERNVLLLTFAPELDPTFEQLFAYVQDDAGRKYATPHLALALFGGEREERLAAHDSLLAQAPLRRLRLVILGAGPTGAAPGSRALRLEERAGNYLLGVNQPDERVAPLLRPTPTTPLLPAHADLVEGLRRWMESGASGRRPLLNLIGPSGSGKLAIARELCERLGVGLCRLDPARLPAVPAEREEMLRLLEREAVLLPTAFYLDAELDAADRERTTVLEDLVERLGVLLIAGSRERWPTEGSAFAVRVPPPDAASRHAVWLQALDGVRCSLNGQLEAVVQQFELGPASIVRTVTAARDSARLRSPSEDPEVTADDLWQACREQARGPLDQLAQRIVPCQTWDDLVAPEDVLRQLREIAGQVAQRAQVYEVWGFGAKLSRGRGISALFSGPSGTGKTMAAEILAHHLQLDLHRIDLSGVVSKYVGETEKNLRKVFDAAEQSGAILFFDEADALFGKRSEIKDSHDRYANIEISYLLQRMEDYRGLAILATNLKSHLDQAFLRRLRFLVEFPFPDPAQRLRIWQQVFPRQAEVEGLDLAALARLGVAGGNIKTIALNAAFLASGEAAPVRMEHVLRAARREYLKIEKLILETEFGVYYAQVHR